LDRREQLGDQVRPWVEVRERHSNIKRLRGVTRLFVLVIAQSDDRDDCQP
jgi:hypothetical protein